MPRCQIPNFTLSVINFMIASRGNGIDSHDSPLVFDIPFFLELEARLSRLSNTSKLSPRCGCRWFSCKTESMREDHETWRLVKLSVYRVPLQFHRRLRSLPTFQTISHSLARFHWNWLCKWEYRTKFLFFTVSNNPSYRLDYSLTGVNVPSYIFHSINFCFLYPHTSLRSFFATVFFSQLNLSPFAAYTRQITFINLHILPPP